MSKPILKNRHNAAFENEFENAQSVLYGMGFDVVAAHVLLEDAEGWPVATLEHNNGTYTWEPLENVRHKGLKRLAKALAKHTGADWSDKETQANYYADAREILALHPHLASAYERRMK